MLLVKAHISPLPFLQGDPGVHGLAGLKGEKVGSCRWFLGWGGRTWGGCGSPAQHDPWHISVAPQCAPWGTYVSPKLCLYIHAVSPSHFLCSVPRVNQESQDQRDR